MILSNKRITMVLTRLRGYAGWSGPLLFENPEDGGGGGGGVNLGAIQNVYIFIYCSLIFIPYLLSVNTVYK